MAKWVDLCANPWVKPRLNVCFCFQMKRECNYPSGWNESLATAAFSSSHSRHHSFAVFKRSEVLCHLCAVLYLCLCLISNIKLYTAGKSHQTKAWCILLSSKCQVCDHAAACCMLTFISLNLHLTVLFPLIIILFSYDDIFAYNICRIVF